MLRWIKQIVSVHKLHDILSDYLLEYFCEVGCEGNGTVILSMDSRAAFSFVDGYDVGSFEDFWYGAGIKF